MVVRYFDVASKSIVLKKFGRGILGCHNAIQIFPRLTGFYCGKGVLSVTGIH